MGWIKDEVNFNYRLRVFRVDAMDAHGHGLVRSIRDEEVAQLERRVIALILAHRPSLEGCTVDWMKFDPYANQWMIRVSHASFPKVNMEWPLLEKVPEERLIPAAHQRITQVFSGPLDMSKYNATHIISAEEANGPESPLPELMDRALVAQAAKDLNPFLDNANWRMTNGSPVSPATPLEDAIIPLQSEGDDALDFFKKRNNA